MQAPHACTHAQLHDGPDRERVLVGDGRVRQVAAAAMPAMAWSGMTGRGWFAECFPGPGTLLCRTKPDPANPPNEIMIISAAAAAAAAAHGHETKLEKYRAQCSSVHHCIGNHELYNWDRDTLHDVRVSKSMSHGMSRACLAPYPAPHKKNTQPQLSLTDG